MHPKLGAEVAPAPTGALGTRPATATPRVMGRMFWNSARGRPTAVDLVDPAYAPVLRKSGPSTCTSRLGVAPGNWLRQPVQNPATEAREQTSLARR